MRGTLYVVATPLGNLEDLSPRARRTLREAACIACEDTRRTAKLLARFALETPLLSCHKFNERERLEPVLRLLAEGKDIALVSDGGTPGVSDPGALLVRAVLDAGFSVSPIPGPSAPAALLSVSGLSADRFVFEGFLPHRTGERRRRLRELRSEPRTWVLLEAPHRIRGTLADLEAILGPRTVVLGRELTKIHEEVIRGSPSAVLAALGEGEIRGELTLAVAGAAEGEPETADVEQSALLRRVWAEALEASGGDRREALRRAAGKLGLKRPELWRRLAEIGEPSE